MLLDLRFLVILNLTTATRLAAQQKPPITVRAHMVDGSKMEVPLQAPYLSKDLKDELLKRHASTSSMG